MLLMAACALEPGRGELEAEVVATAPAGTSWVDEDGHAFQLEEGTLTIADLLLMEPNPLVARSWADWLLPTAYAHPGHDSAGPVAGELLGEYPIDLAADEVALGFAPLYEGDYGGAELSYVGAARFVGTVDGRPFAITVTPDQHITAIPFDARFTMADAPVLELSIDAAWMLSFVDWDDLPDDDGDGILTEADGDVANLVRFGLHSNAAFAVSEQ